MLTFNPSFLLRAALFLVMNFHYFLAILQPQAREKAEKEGFEIGIAKTSFKANTKALAENEGEGLAKVAMMIFSN